MTSVRPTWRRRSDPANAPCGRCLATWTYRGTRRASRRHVSAGMPAGVVLPPWLSMTGVGVVPPSVLPVVLGRLVGALFVDDGLLPIVGAVAGVPAVALVKATSVTLAPTSTRAMRPARSAFTSWPDGKAATALTARPAEAASVTVTVELNVNVPAMAQ